jgi:threonine aldolase
MCAFDTTEADIDSFVEAICAVLAATPAAGVAPASQIVGHPIPGEAL